MKIKKLIVDSFLGIKQTELEFGNINIIAGANWSGKSSLQQALRVALSGEIARVKLKGQYHLLVRDGAKKAKVSVVLDDGLIQEVIIPLTGKSDIPNCDDEVIKIALDQQRFVSMTDDEKRKALFGLFPKLFDSERIVKRMLDLGANPSKTSDILPLLHKDFDGAYAEAKSKTKEARAAWKAITGETYGSDKAEKWEHVVDVEEVTKSAHSYAKIAQSRNELIKQVDAQEKVVTDWRVKHLTSATEYTCEKCNHHHTYDQEAADLIKEELDAQTASLNFMKQALEQLTIQLNMADVSAESLKTIEAVSKAKTEEALKQHTDVTQWAHIEELLSDSGVMSEILADALKPLNKRLAQSSLAADFGTVQIHQDMTISVDGRLYGLVSEAQQWMTQALICEAISHIAGLNVVVLDRIDVLSVENRGKLINWCNELSENNQFILFGTLKSKPEIEGVNGFWVTNGEVS